MSHTPRRVAARLAATGLLLSSLPAAAATGPVVTPTDPCNTYSVTLAGCQNPVHSCELAAFEKAKTDPNATCNTLIKNAAESEAASMPKRTVLVPRLTRSDGSSVPPQSFTKVVPFQKDNPNTHTMSGLSSFYLGQVHRAQTYIPADSAYSDSLAASRKQQRDTWNANGNVLASCSEYVYEKYYDYSLFEDAIVGYGNNYRSIYTAAYAPGRLGVVPSYAIATRALADPIQRGKDGTPITPAITFPANQPKNQFFTVPLPVSSKVTILKGDQDMVTVSPGGPVFVVLKNLQRPGLNLTGVTFVDPNLAPTLSAGATYYDESWAWHKEMNLRNAGLLDEELYQYEAQQEDFAALLQKREELVNTIAGMFNPKPPPSATPIQYVENYWRDPLWNPDPTRVTEFAEVGLDVIPLPTLSATSPSLASTPQPLPGYSTIDSTGVRSLCGGNPVICLLYRLEALDAAIEESLHKAQARGCLTFNTTGPAACDWSPKRFAQRVMKLYQGERERAYDKCNQFTDSFLNLKNQSMSAGSLYYPPTDYTTSPAALELYFTRRLKYLTELRGALGDLIDPVTRNARVKWESGGSYTLGDDTFGASATYNIAFGLNGLGTASDCDVAPKATGSFKATGRALGKSVDLVNAWADVDPEHAEVHLDVFDNTIHVVNVSKDLILTEFNVVSGSKMWSKEFINVEATFLVVVVPVTLGASVSGTVGLNYGLAVKKATTTDGSGTCKVNGTEVGGHLSPFASVDGELYAGVDLLVVSAGVKGRLQLVHASLPLTASGALLWNAQQNKVVLDMRARADLGFTFMSGSIGAYVEVGVCPLCTDFEETLVSWDGLRYSLNLFNRSVSVPLGDVQYLIKHPL